MKIEFKCLALLASLAVATSVLACKHNVGGRKSHVYRIIEFGQWPQTVKSPSVIIEEPPETRQAGPFTYYKGDDDAWYCKVKENGNSVNYKYSDGSRVRKGGTSERWFKVEPIKWKVLTDNYNGTSNKLLLAEKALVPCQFFDSAEDVRKRGALNDIGVYPSNYEYSKVRAFLNGIPYDIMESGSQKLSTEFEMKGFLQTAFTFEERKKILRTLVDNSPESTNPDGNPNLWSSGKNDYACGDTNDHVFLLSAKEATTASYGFAAHDVHIQDGSTTESTRIQIATDFALANGAAIVGGRAYWWLRSPVSYTSGSTIYRARSIYESGSVSDDMSDDRATCVVPALCIGSEAVQ